MDKSDILDYLKVGERITFECKKAENAVPKSVWETYSSFANTIGGTIILGIKENTNEDDVEKRFEITGIADARKIKKEFFDTINSNKVNRNILTDGDVEEVVFDNKTLLCIHVPQADYRQRPIYINGNMLSGSFKRNYEGDYHCNEDEVKAMIRDANDSGNDGVLMENYGMEDIDKPTLAAYRNRFSSLNPDHVWNEYDDKTFLLNMGGFTKDRNTQREGLTLAGLLMFGQGLAIRERFDNIRMDYLDLTNLAPESRWSDRLTYDGRWENNLYNFFTRVLSKLVNDIKRPFSLTNIVREDDSPVHKLIREALTNMVIHADYMMTGVLKVERCNDKLVFSNPGSLKLPIFDIYNGGHSEARNPKMQTMLRMIGMGDNIGSGFPTMLDACKKENWRKPILNERTELRLIELTISMISLISPETDKSLLEIYGNNYRKITKEEQYVLATALTEGCVANYTIQLQLDKNPLEAGKLLYAMVDKKLLVSTNKGRWTTYSVNRDYKTNMNEKSRSKSQGVDEKSRSKSQGVDEKSRSKSQGVDEKSRSKSQGVSELDQGEWRGEKGELLYETAWSKHRREVLERLLKYCQKPRTLTEIAIQLGFADKYRMKKVYIDPLLDKGISMTEAKNAPNQKYVTIATKENKH